MNENGISDTICIQLSQTTALFAANGRCCTTMQVSVKIETEETASSDAQMNDDGSVISGGFRANVPPGLIRV